MKFEENRSRDVEIQVNSHTHTQTDGHTDDKKILLVRMYAMMFYPFIKFEVNCPRPVLDIALDMHFHIQNGRQSAIFDPIMKSLHVHMHHIRY